MALTTASPPTFLSAPPPTRASFSLTPLRARCALSSSHPPLTMAKASFIFRAKLAEQAERYHEMKTCMKEVRIAMR